MRTAALTFCLALALTLTATAQSDLTISGTLNSGGDITFGVTGAPANSPTAVLAGMTGQTNFGFLTIDLAGPIVPVAVGQTDMNGDFSQTFNIPPTMIGMTFSFDSQALSVDLSGATGGGPMGGFMIVLSDVETASLAL